MTLIRTPMSIRKASSTAGRGSSFSIRTIGSLDLCNPKQSGMHGAVRHDGAGQLGASQGRTSENCAGQARAGQIGSGQVGARKVRAVKVCLGQLHTLEVRVAQ